VNNSSRWAGRFGWILGFLIFLIAVICAGPVLADEGAPQDDKGSLYDTNADISDLPTRADVAEGLAIVAEEEAQAEAELAEPASILERQESQTAFAELTPDAARELIHAEFAEVFDALNADPARLLSDAVLRKVLDGGEGAAIVAADGRPELLEAGVPVVAQDEGETKKVDLTLVEGKDGLEPENPIVPTVLPEQANEPTTIGEQGLAIAVTGAGDSDAEALGDKNAFYYEARKDADLIISPMSKGVELFEQLRSVESPEELTYAITVPAGAELKSDGNGGAVVEQGNTPLGHMPFPTAVDAQGTEVPVELEVNADSVTLHVPHGGGEYAYPILVDPAFVEDWASCSWYYGCNLGALEDPNVWVWGDTGNGWIYHDRTCFWTCWGSGRGLYIGAEWGTHGPGQWGQWTYTPPGSTSWIASAGLNPFWRNNYNCPKSSFPQPHDYDGLWSPTNGWVPIEANMANDVGSAGPAGYGRSLVVGIGTAEGWATNNCNRTIMLGGVSVAITDSDVPYWNVGPSASDAWTDTTVLPISGTATDNGLGMRYFNLYRSPNGGTGYDFIGNTDRGCSGLKQNACPATWTGTISNYSVAALPTGVNWLMMFAYDPFGLEHNSQGLPIHINVDHAAPTLAKSGELFAASPNVFKGEVVASDGNSGDWTTAQSGMKQLEILVDGVRAGRYPDVNNPPACNNVQSGINVGSCQQKVPVELSRKLFGKHEVTLRAWDSLNHKTEETVALELPKDTTAPTLAITGPLKTMAGGWLNAEATSVTLEAKDAQAGVVEELVYIDNVQVGKETQLCNAGGCPLTHTFPVSLAGYSSGLHTVKVLAKDQVNIVSETSWSIGVDTAVPTLTSVTAPEVPAGWTPQVNSFVVNYAAADVGAGVKRVEVSRPSSTGTTLVTNPYNSTCTQAAANPCPVTTSGTATISTATMAQGIDTVTVKAYDALGKVSSARTFTVHVDRSAPTFTRAVGPLLQGGTAMIGLLSKVDLGVQDYGSGIASLEVLVDGEVLEHRSLSELLDLGATQACSGETCQLTYVSEAIVGADLEPGPHTVKFAVTDAAGLSVTRTNNLVIDTRTPEVELSGPLFESQGESLAGGSGTLQVQADDGPGPYDSGVASVEFAVDGQPVQAKVGLVAVDENNNRVEEFSSAGAFIRAFGTTGSGDGQLSRPAGVAVDGAGNIWVSDANNNRVEKFSESGEFLAKYGTLGTGNGQFKDPEGIAVDAKGNVWVADTYNARIQELNSKGEFMRVVGSGGKLVEPTGIDFGPGGTVWVADWSLNRIVVFKENGELAFQFGTAGTGNGQFNRPDAIDVDAEGNVWVGDQNNGRVQVFNQQGEYEMQYGSKGTGAGQFTFGYPFGLERGPKGEIWVADSNNNRIQKWAMPAGAAPSQPTYTTSFGAAGTGNGQFSRPANVAIDAKGNIWAVDLGNNRVQEFNEAGTFIRAFGSTGTGDGQFSRPAGITVDPKGYVWVADAGNNRIQKFSELGVFVAKYGTLGSGNGQFNGPEGVVADAKGYIWVSDTYNGRVQELNEKGEWVRTVGSPGSAPGQIGEATGIDTGPGGTIWVADWQNNRVSVFKENGEFLRQFGSSGSGDGQFSHPDAVDVDSRGNVWVADELNSRVQGFNQQGEFQTKSGSKGVGAGQFSFGYPMGIASDGRGNLWVSDTFNNRIQKWTVPGYRPTYESSFGSAGTGNSQFNHVGDLAIVGAPCGPGFCSAHSSRSFTYDESTWGPGPHTVSVTVTDGAGNVDVEEVRVNEPLNVVAPECPTAAPQILSGGAAVSTSAAVAQVEAVIPAALKPNDPSGVTIPTATDEPEGVSLDELGIDVEGAEAGGGIEDEPAGDLTVGQAACLQPMETTAAALDPTIVNEAAVIYPNSAPNTDTVVRPLAAGTAVISSFRGAEAPSHVAWKVHLEPGQELVALDDGGVAVVNPDGFDFDPAVVPPAPEPSLDELTDAQIQIAMAEHDLLAANAEIEGEVVMVIPPPELYGGTETFTPGMLTIVNPTTVWAELPPNLRAETEAMLIRLAPPAEPESICASVAARVPELAWKVCGGDDPDNEEGGEADPAMSLGEINSWATDSGFKADLVGAGHELALMGPAGYEEWSIFEIPETEWQEIYCESHRERCRKYNWDGAQAAMAEEDLYNGANSDDTMANAFRHSLWNGLMHHTYESVGPRQAIVYSDDHEEFAWSRIAHPDEPVEVKRSRMDILNNRFGYWHFKETDMATCETIRHKVNAEGVFINPKRDPWKWGNEVGYHYARPVYRKLKAYPSHQVVTPTGLACTDVRAGIGPAQANPLDLGFEP
jgi:sugar lactone lactonase YvrE